MKRDVVGAAAIFLSRVAAMPRTPWQMDELAIMAALQGIAPEPRYPLYVGFSKAAYLLIGDPFITLMVVNVLASVFTFLMLSPALTKLLGDEDVAFATALIFSLSAGFVVQSSAALPEAMAMCFVAAMFYAFAHERDLSLGVCASLAVGCMPSLAFAVVPALVVAALLRRRVLPLAMFAAVSVLWGVPWLESGGGFVTPHAELHGLAHALPRFALHPWGGKLVTVPLLLCALAGAYAVARRFERRTLPLFVFAAANLLLALLTADPQYGVRPAVPSMLLTAFLAASGLALARRPIVTLTGAAFLGALSFAYVWPLVRERATQPSPVVIAADHARRTLAENSIVATYGDSSAATRALLPQFEQMPLDEALRRFTARADVPVMAFFAGTSQEPEANVFTAPDSDIHRKLLGSVSRGASLDPVRPRERYVPLRSAYNFERTPAGTEWRWLGPDAIIHLPPTYRSTGTLTLRLSEDTPYDSSIITVGDAQLTVTKTPVTFRVEATRDLTIRSARSFTPATTGSSADQRLLSVQLMDLEF